MKICVCGLGKVGLPILNMLRTKGFSVVGYDIDPKRTQCSLPFAVENSDAVIVIVPTPSLSDGSFSNSYVIHALGYLKAEAERQGKRGYLFIVSSTVVPGSCNEFRNLVGDQLVYKPEFIRLEHVDADLLVPSFVLIGEASERAGKRCSDIFAHVTDAPIFRMKLVEAELAKITLNCALTMKISLANQLHLVAQKMGASSSRIMFCVGADPRIGPQYLEPGRPYEGACLPRDNAMFQFVAKQVGVDACLSRAADKINEAVR